MAEYTGMQLLRSQTDLELECPIMKSPRLAISTKPTQFEAMRHYEESRMILCPNCLNYL